MVSYEIGYIVTVNRCNDYVKAGKRLTVKRAPNILTIALKRFQVSAILFLYMFLG